MTQSDASQDLKYGGSGAAIPTVAINAAGGLLFAALFTADQRAADTRISRRDKVPCLAEGLPAFLIMTSGTLLRMSVHLHARQNYEGPVHAWPPLVSSQVCNMLLLLTAVMQVRVMQSIGGGEHLRAGRMHVALKARRTAARQARRARAGEEGADWDGGPGGVCERAGRAHVAPQGGQLRLDHSPP